MGWKVGCSERRGSFQGDSLDRQGDGLLRVHLFFLSLFRMSGEYPNSVSICKYLQDQLCLWSPTTSLSSFNSMTPKDVRVLEWVQGRLRDTKRELALVPRGKQWVEKNNNNIMKYKV